MFDLYSDWMFGLSVCILSIRWKLKKFMLEVFTRCIEKFDEFEGCYKIGTWLDRTTHNASMDTLRSREPSLMMSEISVRENSELPIPAIFTDWRTAPEHIVNFVTFLVSLRLKDRLAAVEW